MPGFPVQIRRVDYTTQQGDLVTAWRPFVRIGFQTTAGADIPYRLLIDSGAPFNVVPFSLWSVRQLRWTRLASQLRGRHSSPQDPLTWQGVPCALGAAVVHLKDPLSRRTIGPYLLVGKFPERPAGPGVEGVAVLGVNFLTDHSERLELDGDGGVLTGSFPDLQAAQP